METEYTAAYDMNALILTGRDFKKSSQDILEFADKSGAIRTIGRLPWILIESASGRTRFHQVGTFVILWEKQLHDGGGSFWDFLDRYSNRNR